METLTKYQAKALHNVITIREKGEQLFAVMLRGKGIIVNSYMDTTKTGFVFYVNYRDNKEDTTKTCSVVKENNNNLGDTVCIDDFTVYMLSDYTKYEDGVMCTECGGKESSKDEEPCFACNGSGVIIEADMLLENIRTRRKRTIFY